MKAGTRRKAKVQQKAEVSPLSQYLTATLTSRATSTKCPSMEMTKATMSTRVTRPSSGGRSTSSPAAAGPWSCPCWSGLIILCMAPMVLVVPPMSLFLSPLVCSGLSGHCYQHQRPASDVKN